MQTKAVIHGTSMLSRGVLRILLNQPIFAMSNHLMATATSSNLQPIRRQESKRENERDFRKIERLVERIPPPRKKLKELKLDNLGPNEEEKEESPEVGSGKKWKKYIGQKLHDEYSEHATKQRLERWRRKVRQNAFCYVRDRNLLDLISHIHQYTKKQLENIKSGHGLPFDDELISVLIKFAANEFAQKVENTEWKREFEQRKELHNILTRLCDLLELIPTDELSKNSLQYSLTNTKLFRHSERCAGRLRDTNLQNRYAELRERGGTRTGEQEDSTKKRQQMPSRKQRKVCDTPNKKDLKRVEQDISKDA